MNHEEELRRKLELAKKALTICYGFCTNVIEYGALRSEVDVPKVFHARDALAAALAELEGS